MRHQSEPARAPEAWKNQAEREPFATFPVRLFRNQAKGKIDKRPHPDWAKGDVHSRYPLSAYRDYQGGYGMRMGKSGTDAAFYALDLDDHKSGSQAEAFIRRHNFPPTRTHLTVNGGRHMIYQLPPEFADLGNRANVVQGLDTRGKGGFIAYGQGYALLDPRPPVLMPASLCALFQRPAHIDADIGGIDIDAVDRAALKRKLNALLMTSGTLARRWRGDTKDLEGSASSMDYSVAFSLSSKGFDEAEIAVVLLELFPHGQARRSSVPQPRASLRAAARAKANNRHIIKLAHQREIEKVKREIRSTGGIIWANGRKT